MILVMMEEEEAKQFAGSSLSLKRNKGKKEQARIGVKGLPQGDIQRNVLGYFISTDDLNKSLTVSQNAPLFCYISSLEDVDVDAYPGVTFILQLDETQSNLLHFRDLCAQHPNLRLEGKNLLDLPSLKLRIGLVDSFNRKNCIFSPAGNLGKVQQLPLEEIKEDLYVETKSQKETKSISRKTSKRPKVSFERGRVSF